jgi:hypothetical protein
MAQIAPDILAELSKFDDGFAPEQPRSLKVEDLADGQHTFEVLDLDVSKTEKKGDMIVKWCLLVCDGAGKGSLIEHVHWLGDQDAVNRLGKDLVAVGYPAAKWADKTSGLKFAVEFARIVPALPGMVFVGKKRTYTPQAVAGAPAPKTGHYLDFLRLVSAGTGKPSRQPPEKVVSKKPAAPF